MLADGRFRLVGCRRVCRLWRLIAAVGTVGEVELSDACEGGGVGGVRGFEDAIRHGVRLGGLDVVGSFADVEDVVVAADAVFGP